MRPKKHETTGSDDLFRARLDQIINIVTTNARAPGGQFVLHARTLPGNPYDGHTLGAVIEATERLTGPPAARSSVPMSTRDTAATMPQTRAESSSQAKNAGSSAASNASSRGAPPSRR
jgi:hypothetical protein